MLNFKKHYILKIVNILIAGIFIIDTTGYGYASPNESSLRVPSMTTTEKGRNRLNGTMDLMLNSTSNLSLYFSGNEHPYKIDTRGLLEIKDLAYKNISEIKGGNITSIYVNKETGEKTFFKEGDPLVILDADVYIKEGENWGIPQGINLPSHILDSLNNEKGAFVFISGPFYVTEENAPTTQFIRALKDEEIYKRFGLRRVLDNGKPFTVPVLGIGGRSILLPISYSITGYDARKCNVFGLEFKNAGTPGYKKHNISNVFLPTVYKEYIGKPGIFLDWWHQVVYKIPVGLGEKDLYSEKREKMLLENGGNLTRLTLGTLNLFDEYGIVIRAPSGDYRRLSAYFNGKQPDRSKFYSIVQELYPDDSLGVAIDKYFGELVRNYGINLKALLVTGILQGGDGSLINVDLDGLITDLDDYEKISLDGNSSTAHSYVKDWIDNLVKVLNIPGVEFKYISNKAFGEFVKNAVGKDILDSAELDDIDKISTGKIAGIIIKSMQEQFLISGENTETTPVLLELNEAVEKLEKEVDILPESMRNQIEGLGIIASSKDVFKQLQDIAEQERPILIDNKIIKDLREKLENVKWDNEMRENEVVYDWWKDYSSVWVKMYELLQLEHKEFSEDIIVLRVFADIYKGLFYSIREDGKLKPDLEIRQRIDNAIEDFGLYKSGEAIPYEIRKEDLGQGLECFVVEPDATSSNIIFLRYFNKEVQQYEFVMVDGGSRQFTGALKNEIFPKIGLINLKEQLKTIIFTHGDADHLSGGLAFAKEYGIHFRADPNLFETTGDRSLPQKVLQHALMGDFARIAFLGEPIDFDPGIKDLFEPYPGHGNQGEVLLGDGSFNVLCYQDIGDTKWAVVQTGGHTQDSIMLLGPLRDEKGIDRGEFTAVITGDIGVSSLLTPVQKRMIKASQDMKGGTIAHVYPGTAEIVDKWLGRLPDAKIIPSHGKPYNSPEIDLGALIDTREVFTNL